MDEYKRRTAKYEAMNPIAPPIRKSRTAKRNLTISTEFAHSAPHLITYRYPKYRTIEAKLSKFRRDAQYHVP